MMASSGSDDDDNDLTEDEMREELEGFGTFLQLKKSLSEKTTKHHKMMVRVFLKQAGTLTPTDADVMVFRQKMLDDDYSNSHINNTHNGIEYFFEYQDREDELEDYKSRPRASVDPFPFDDEEVSELLASATEFRDRVLVRFLVTSGVRNSSTTRLTFGDVDLEKRTANIEEAKEHNQYTAIFSEQVAEMLKQYKEGREASEDDPVFRSRNGGNLTRSGLLQAVKRLGRSADIEDVTVHRFRATFANQMRQNGADIYRIKELMGHRDIRSTLKYLQMDEDELREEHDEFVGDFDDGEFDW